MPINPIYRSQRFYGGTLGVAVLGCALVYHFFPRVFHVDPAKLAPHQSVSSGQLAGGSTNVANVAAASNELTAGPPLTLAPTDVIAARMSKQNQHLPKQLSDDPPAVQALLDRAGKALRTGDLVGGDASAAALYAQAVHDKPDSRRAAQGLYEVRSRLVAQISQDIAMGDAETAQDRLTTLRTLPNAAEEVAELETSLNTLSEIRPMLSRAATLLQQGQVDRPRGHSALDLYRQVLKRDPQNAMAEQGIFQVQHAVLDRALAAVAQNDFGAADRAVAQAETIRSGSQQLVDTRNRIDGMRQSRASGVLVQARSALDAGNLALAQKLAGQARAISPALVGLADFDEHLINARLYANYKPGQVFTDRYVDLPGHTPDMVVIPTGAVLMGAPDSERDHSDAETPQHTVTLAYGFALARTDVTVAQFREFVRVSAYQADSVKLGGASVYDERSGALRDDARATWQDDYAGHTAKDNLPVVNVSWNDAKAYTDWLSQRTGKRYRLPSEAEFEYALRGNTRSRYWWGTGKPASKVENMTGAGDRSPSGRRWSNAFAGYRDGYWGPAPVMSFAANPFGLYDIDGNVSAWVADCWHDNYVRAPRDGGAWINPGCSLHVVRGGSWGSSPDQVRSAYRQGAAGSTRNGRVGFRIVREL